MLSVINMKLRDEFDSLDGLCEELQLDRAKLIQNLAEAGYYYDENVNRFRGKE